MLSKEARDYFDYLVKEFNIPKNQHDTLEIGVFYLFEWKAMAAKVAAGKIKLTVLDKGNNANRLNPRLRYFERCWQNWDQVAKSYGFHPLGQKRIAGVHKPNAKTKRMTRVPLRKDAQQSK